MPTKIHFIIALSAIGLLGGCLAAYAHEGENHGLPEVTYEALGAEEPSLLPSSPFYFLKEWKRKISLVFTFSAVKKAEKELQFASERAAELKALTEKDAHNIEAMTRALTNYQASAERARTRFNSLVNNPNAVTLLQKVAERAAAHQTFFTTLQQKFADETDIAEKTGEISKMIGGSVVPATTPAGQNAAPQATPGVPQDKKNQKSNQNNNCSEADAIVKKYEPYGARLLTDPTISRAYQEDVAAAAGICVKRQLQNQ